MPQAAIAAVVNQSGRRDRDHGLVERLAIKLITSNLPIALTLNLTTSEECSSGPPSLPTG